jgi:hypothetical protein
MVDGVAGGVVSSQLQTATKVSVQALKTEKELTEATVKAIEDTSRKIANDSGSSNGRGSIVNIKV